MMKFAAIESSAKFPEWITSVLLGFTLMGGYFCYQAFGGMKHRLDTILSKETLAAIPIMYHTTSVFAVLSVVPLIRRIGLKVCLVLFAFVCFAGALLELPSPQSQLVGRSLLGLGLEPLGVATLAAAARWLTQSNRALYLAVILSLARLGLSLADLAPLAGVDGWHSLGYASVVFSCLSFLCALVLFFQTQTVVPISSIPHTSTSPRLFGTLIIISTFFFASILIFRMYGGDYFIHEDKNISTTIAGRLIGITSFLPLIGSVPFGRIADRLNRHTWFIAGGCLLLPPAYLILGTNGGAQYSTIFALVLVGCAYAAVPSSLWSSVGKVVGSEKLLFAYSRVLAILNATMAVAYGLDFYLENIVKSQSLILLVGTFSFMAVAASLLFAMQWKRTFRMKEDG